MPPEVNCAVENETARSTRTVDVMFGNFAVEPAVGQPRMPPDEVQFAASHQSPSETSLFHV